MPEISRLASLARNDYEVPPLISGWVDGGGRVNTIILMPALTQRKTLALKLEGWSRELNTTRDVSGSITRDSSSRSPFRDASRHPGLHEILSIPRLVGGFYFESRRLRRKLIRIARQKPGFQPEMEHRRISGGGLGKNRVFSTSSGSGRIPLEMTGRFRR